MQPNSLDARQLGLLASAFAALGPAGCSPPGGVVGVQRATTPGFEGTYNVTIRTRAAEAQGGGWLEAARALATAEFEKAELCAGKNLRVISERPMFAEGHGSYWVRLKCVEGSQHP